MKIQRVIKTPGTYRVTAHGAVPVVYRNRTRLRTSHDERADTVHGAGEVWEGRLDEGDIIEADGVENLLLMFR